MFSPEKWIPTTDEDGEYIVAITAEVVLIRLLLSRILAPVETVEADAQLITPAWVFDVTVWPPKIEAEPVAPKEVFICSTISITLTLDSMGGLSEAVFVNCARSDILIEKIFLIKNVRSCTINKSKWQ